MDFDSTIGKVFGFYGVDGETFKLGKYVFEVVADESDGYRSYLEKVETKKLSKEMIFFKQPIANVRVADDADLGGYQLVDVVDGHVWLRFGTDYSDDYYPQCVFRYEPKKA